VLACAPASTVFSPRLIANIDRLIVADLMQERVMLDRAPVAAEQRVEPIGS